MPVLVLAAACCAPLVPPPILRAASWLAAISWRNARANALPTMCVPATMICIKYFAILSSPRVRPIRTDEPRRRRRHSSSLLVGWQCQNYVLAREYAILSPAHQRHNVPLTMEEPNLYAHRPSAAPLRKAACRKPSSHWPCSAKTKRFVKQLTIMHLIWLDLTLRSGKCSMKVELFLL